MEKRVTIVQIGKTVEFYPVGKEGDEVSSRAVGERTGEAHVSVQFEDETRSHRVKFDPLFADDYVLTVLQNGSHAKGSPHKIKVLGKETIISDESEIKQSIRTVAVVEVDSSVNFVLRPENSSSDPSIVVTGPSGPLHTASTVSMGDGQYITHFAADMEGEYYISSKCNGKHLRCSPLKVVSVAKRTRVASSSELSQCYILPEDVQHLSRPYSMKELVDLRVCTQGAADGKFNVEARGPGKATVVITKESHTNYVVTVSPSRLGRYLLNLKWNNQHIRGSPCSFLVANEETAERQNKLDALDFAGARFRVGKMYKFKVHSGSMAKGSFVLNVDPPSDASVTVQQANSTTHHISLVPSQPGPHTISVLSGGKHIDGSPFPCEFVRRGDASKCFLVEDNKKHEHIEDEVTFTVSTEGAGEGTLTAAVFNIAKNTTRSAEVFHHTDSLFRIHLSLDQEDEYLLHVRYDGTGIVGSPFKLSLSVQPDPQKCVAEGEGLKVAHVNKESAFTVVTDGTRSDLKVKIAGPQGSGVHAFVTKERKDHYRVAYTPKTSGEHTVSVLCDNNPIAGSPFRVNCIHLFSPTSIQVIKSSVRDSAIGHLFSFHLKHDIDVENKVTVVAFGPNNENIEGTFADLGNGTSAASFDPSTEGVYKVHVCYEGQPISGSPVEANVLSDSSASKVNAYGPGLQNGVVGERGNFVVETKDARAGSLTVRIHGRRGSFAMNMLRDPVNSRNILVQYNPVLSGDYLVDVFWSSVPIPGSPFKVHIQEEQL
uniref:Filamin-like 4 n=1 Tax=Halisarca dujardinii TaxID=2583056 RepID=A0A9F1U428_HALDU|nr:filamin-like 4 [Halisarca dujardinii]